MNSAWQKFNATSSFRGYLIAVGACLGALFFARIFHTPTASFVVAVMITSYLGSRTAGYVATAFAGLLFYFSFLSLNASFVVLSSPHHQLIAFLVTGCIISEVSQMSRRIEQKRQRSVAQLETMMDTCPDAILLLDASMKISCLNPAAITVFGYERHQLLHQPIGKVIPCFRTDTALPGDFDAYTASGEHLKVSATWREFGQQISVFLRDVTDKRRMVAELKASEENLKLLVETIPALIHVRDAGGSLLQVNHRVTDYNGLTLEQVLGANGLAAVHPDDAQRVGGIFSRQFRLGEPFNYEFRQRRHDGQYRWFRSHAEPLKNQDGEVVRWYSVLTDIDEHKAMEASVRSMQADLAEADRTSTVSEIAASVIHEISQPLSAIAFNAQICNRSISAEVVDREQLGSAVERILKNSREASQTVKNIRALFRRRDPNTQPVDVHQIMKEVLLLHEPQIRGLGIAVNLSVDDNLPTIPADRLQIQQVLVNLVLNAIEAMEGNEDIDRELDVCARGLDGKILIQIADRGHGLLEPDRLFDPFFTTKEAGMGMGLRICKTIVESHRGMLWAERREGRGSAFVFTLPVAQPIRLLNGHGTEAPAQEHPD